MTILFTHASDVKLIDKGVKFPKGMEQRHFFCCWIHWNVVCFITVVLSHCQCYFMIYRQKWTRCFVMCNDEKYSSLSVFVGDESARFDWWGGVGEGGEGGRNEGWFAWRCRGREFV